MTRTAAAMLISVAFFTLAACAAHGAEGPPCGKVIGGAGSDWGTTAQETEDGGFVMAGFIGGGSTGERSPGILKFDAHGKEVWRRDIGARTVKQTSDGGFLAAGKDWLVKLNRSGEIVWEKSYDDLLKKSPAQNVERYSPASLLKEKWAKIIGEDGSYNAYAIGQTDAGNYIVAGPMGNGKATVREVKASTGDVISEKLYQIDWGIPVNGVVKAHGGGFVFAGEYTHEKPANSEITHTYEGFVVFKTDKDGVVVWEREYGGQSKDEAYGIDSASDGGYVVTGTTKSNAFIDPNNSEILQKILNEDCSQLNCNPEIENCEENKQECEHSKTIIKNCQNNPEMTFEEDGEKYKCRDLFAAVALADIWLVKIDGDGNKQWEKNFGGNEEEDARAVRQTKDGGYVIAGSTASYGNGDNDMWLLRVDKDGECVAGF